MKTKYQQEQFSAYARGGQLVLAINLETILPETAPVKLASAQLEELDYRNLYEAHSTKGRKSAAGAKVMFEVICCGSQCGIYSNRDLEEAGRYTFVWRGRVEKNMAKVKRAVNEGVGLTDKQKLREYLAEKGIAFVHGTGKRIGSLFNAVYLLPKFSVLFGLPLDQIVSMGSAINGHIHSVSTLVLFSVAPLNLLKAVVVSLLTLLLYKRVEKPLFEKVA